MTTATTESKLTKRQRHKFGPKVYTEGGQKYRIIANVRYDDDCGNGHNTFSITGDIDRQAKNGKWCEDSGGCIHKEIAKHFPELAPLIKWHLCSSNGPMHYVANTVYHAGNRNLDAARSCAAWPDATDEELTADGLEERLEARLSALLDEFRTAIESLGFIW